MDYVDALWFVTGVLTGVEFVAVIMWWDHNHE